MISHDCYRVNGGECRRLQAYATAATGVLQVRVQVSYDYRYRHRHKLFYEI